MHSKSQYCIKGNLYSYVTAILKIVANFYNRLHYIVGLRFSHTTLYVWWTFWEVWFKNNLYIGLKSLQTNPENQEIVFLYLMALVLQGPGWIPSGRQALFIQPMVFLNQPIDWLLWFIGLYVYNSQSTWPILYGDRTRVVQIHTHYALGYLRLLSSRLYKKCYRT